MKRRLEIITVLCGGMLFITGCGSGAYTSLIEQATASQMGNGALSSGAKASTGSDSNDVSSNNRDGNGPNFRTPEGGFQSTVGRAFGAANRTIILQKAKNLATAMLSYETNNGGYPPTAILGDDGTPLLSWRVALLKELNPQLYRQFNTKEPWDSPQNKPLSDQLPAEYDMQMRLDPGYTTVLGVVGPETIFQEGKKKGTRSVELRDNSVALFMVAAHRAAVPWAKPQDLSFNGDLVAEATSDGECFLAMSGTNAVRVQNATNEQLKGAFTKAGGENVNFN